MMYPVKELTIRPSIVTGEVVGGEEQSRLSWQEMGWVDVLLEIEVWISTVAIEHHDYIMSFSSWSGS